jgi:thiamine pyrophosphate-dependent acetolactate synthase large subunit-like protein
MQVAEAVGAALAEQGVDTVFGLLGSGNLLVTNALSARGAAFHSSRHESAAVSMADGWARVSGRVGVASVHQGPGLTNALTALAEAAKSRTPLLLLAADTPAAALRSNFRVDQHGLVESVGAVPERIHGPATAAADARRALHRAEVERRPIALMLPIDLQAQTVPEPLPAAPVPAPALHRPRPAPEAVAAAADLVERAERPLIIAGRGAVLAGAREPLEALGARIGALLATSAVANGLFAGLPYAAGIAGGFATPLAASLLPQADLVLAFGAALNRWTTAHGALLGPDALIVQVDVEPEAVGAHVPVALGVVGDAAEAARALDAELGRRGVARQGLRTPELAEALAGRRWHDEPLDAAGTAVEERDGTVDPRTLTIALDRLLPAERTVAVDSGAFLGWPAMYLGVPDAAAWVFSNGFQAVGLGLGSAIGAAVARPDRLTVAAVGDGGALMALGELESAARLGLRLLVVVYDDAAYGAEVHHFGPQGHPVDLVRFPDADLAALARAAGAEGVTVRSLDDLAAVERWLAAPAGPLLADAKVDPRVCGAWLEEAFRAG